MLVVHHTPDYHQLVAAVELKSIASSFGNNLNNRCEEALGAATDFTAALRMDAFGTFPKPFVGYLILMNDCPAIHTPVAVNQQHFKVFREFEGASYARRCELFCQRLITEKLYDAATTLLSPEEKGKEGIYSELSEASSWHNWLATLAGHVATAALTFSPSQKGNQPRQQTLLSSDG